MSITVNAVHRRVQYTGNGSNLGPFSFSFKVLAAGDIKVSEGTTTKTVTTHYTTSLNADGTGTVTFTSGNAPANNAIVTIESDQAIERTTDYSTGGDFTAASINDALDRLTINDQQIETLLSRNIQLPATVNRTTSGTGTSGPLFFPYADTASDQASKLIAYDSNGTALETTTGRVNTVAVSNVAVDGSGNSQDATVSFNSSTGALSLGIPVGSTGAGGSTGSQGPDGVGGLPYTFSTTTTDSDPGAGQIRLNNATLGSVSQIFIDDSTAASGNPDVSAFILTWDDSTQTSDRGQVTIVKKSAQENFATYKLSGASVDASGYVKLNCTHVVSNGSFSNSDAVLVSFVRTGNAGSLSDPMTTRGDIIVRDSSNATARLAAGSANTVLTSDGTDPSYAQVATAMIADDAVTAAKVASDAVVEASIADNAVTLAKMASGTDGNLITYDASGNPAHVATGSSGQVLTSNGAGAAPTFQAAAGGKVVAYSNTHVSTDASTTATFPDDDTAPGSSEGTEYTTFTHTASSATNKILIQVLAQAATNGVVVPVLALFKNSGSTAVRTTFEETHGNGPVMMALQYLDTASSTSEITYKLRFGSSGNTGTVYLGSQHHGGARWNDTGGVNIQIWELEA
jgi:predicted small lipoprotein YifL